MVYMRRAVLHIKRDVLLEATEDVYRFGAIVLDVEDALGVASDAEVRKWVLAIVGSLLEGGYIYAADIDDLQGDFVSWSLKPKDAIERIKERWLVEEEVSARGDEVAWFLSTPKGKSWVEKYTKLLKELDP